MYDSEFSIISFNFPVTNSGANAKGISIALASIFNPNSPRKVPTDFNFICCKSTKVTPNHEAAVQSLSNGP